MGKSELMDQWVMTCPPEKLPRDIIGKHSENHNFFLASSICNADYIAAANPAVVLALIEKIEQLEEKIKAAARSESCEKGNP